LSFLDSEGQVFGQRKVFLVDRKALQSESDLRAEKTKVRLPAAGSSPGIFTGTSSSAS